VLLWQCDPGGDPGLQPLRRHATQLLNRVRGELTLHEQLVVPPLLVEAAEQPPRPAKSLPLRVAALVAQLNTNPAIVTDEDLEQLRIGGYDTYSRIRLPDLLPLIESGDRQAGPLKRFPTRPHYRLSYSAGTFAA
jgi:hypothetical protein